MNFKATLAGMLGTVWLFVSPASAGDPEVERLERLVEQLQRTQQETLAELDRLRARVEGEGPSSTGPPQRSASDADLEMLARQAPTPRRIDFHGHLAFSYFGFEERSLAPEQGGSPSVSDINPQSSFSMTDLSFFVGVPVRDNLYVATEIEYELGGDEIDVDQAFIQWDLRSEERLSLRMGKFYAPFGIERFYQNAPQNPLVDRPAPFAHIVPGTYSETGFALSGRHPLLEGPELVAEFEVAFMNGLGAQLFDSARDARQNRDNNSDKALGGRLGLAYDRWLDLGASWLVGEYDDSDEDRFWTLGADVRASLGRLFLRGEYVYSDLRRPATVDANGLPCSDPTPGCPGATPPLTPLGGSFHRSGWYVEATYRQDPPLSLPLHDILYVLRFDRIDEDDSVRDLLDASRWAMGIVLRPYERFRLKFQYEIIDEDSEEFDNNAFLFEGSVHW